MTGTPDRRSLLKAGGAAVGGLALTGLATAPAHAADAPAPGPDPRLTHGVVTGDVTENTALIWSRADRATQMHVEYGPVAEVEGPAPRPGARKTKKLQVTAARDFIGQFTLRGLLPDTEYGYRVVLCGATADVEGPLATFRTAPSALVAAPVRFTWGADVGQGARNRPPFPSFASMAAERPDFFLFNGDTIYGDGATPAGPGAKTVAEFWGKYKENREDPLFQGLARQTPLIVNWDDHEVDNDYRGQDPTLPAGRLGAGRTAFLDYWPLSSAPGNKSWRCLRWGGELEVFVLDCRQYADPLAKPDGPGKTMLGAQQFRWLLNKVRDSSARWKVLATSCPVSTMRSAKPPYDDWVAYEHELGELLGAWRKANVRNLVWLTADVHYAQAVRYPEMNMWEFLGAPIGANPRVVGSPLSPTFGAQERFLGLNERYYGSVAVDPVSRTMTVDLKLQDGTLKHREVLVAE
ncbi:alkaline phosphatase D family protein [Longispora sp. NPDC051575]|uniref:alkaline phosphatase D family protein n=1 Tax=Longispora sp. NPDC051575 TaxID=3154943 RepID=UPI00341FC499